MEIAKPLIPMVIEALEGFIADCITQRNALRTNLEIRQALPDPEDDEEGLPIAATEQAIIEVERKNRQAQYLLGLLKEKPTTPLREAQL